MFRRTVRRELRLEKIRQMSRLFQFQRRGAEPIQQRVGFRNAGEHDIHFDNIDSDGAKALIGGEFLLNGCGVRALDRRERQNSPANVIELLEDCIDLLTGDTVGRLAKRREYVFDGMRSIGNLRLLDDPSGALERMGQPEQPLD
jgi:hypothetical protein